MKAITKTLPLALLAALPTRGRAQPVAASLTNLISVSLRVPLVKSLPLVGRGWGGVFPLVSKRNLAVTSTQEALHAPRL